MLTLNIKKRYNLIILFIIIINPIYLLLLISNKSCNINNKTILLIGDSQDRESNQYICDKFNGTMKKYYVTDNIIEGNLEGHTYVCNIDNSNTYIITLFHFGIFPMDIESKNMHINISMEYITILNRISTLNNILKHYKINYLDIIVLSSSLWDLFNFDKSNNSNFVEYIKLRNDYLFNNVINYIKINLKNRKLVYRTTPLSNYSDNEILSSLKVSYINYNDLYYLPKNIEIIDLENNMSQDYLGLDKFHMNKKGHEIYYKMIMCKICY